MSPGSSPSSHRGDAASQAADWLARHDRGLTTEESVRFESWCSLNPQNFREFEELRGAWNSFEQGRKDPNLTALASELEQSTRRVRISRRPAISWAFSMGTIGAVAIVLLFTGLWLGQMGPWAPGYRIVQKTALAHLLPDGSTVEVRAESDFQTEFTDHERRVRLVRGEAHFTVKKDPARPFLVTAGSVTVRAVGTAFNVRLDERSVEVLVTEGKVRVLEASTRGQSPGNGTHALGSSSASADFSAAPVVGAGHRVVISLPESKSPQSDSTRLEASGAVEPRAATIAKVSEAEIEQVLAWQKTWLVFERTPLEAAVQAFNEHGSHPLRLGDASIRKRLLGGTFGADNVEGFVRLLELSDDVRAEHLPDGTTVLWSADSKE